MWWTIRPKRGPEADVVHSSISKSPSELPNAAIGRRPIDLMDAHGLSGLVVDEIDGGQAPQRRMSVLHLVLHLGAAADDLLRRHAVDALRPGPHELDAAA